MTTRLRPCSPLVAALVLVAGCASVLGVDKTYVVGDGGTGDAAQVTSPGGIRCAASGVVCQAGPQECCLSSAFALSCVTTSAGCPNGTDIFCDDPSDCPGAVCCIQLDGANSLLGTACHAQCPGGQTELCAPQGGTCAQGRCAALRVQPEPPFSASWFYGCQ